jgi:hydroxypyruvate reductase
MTSYFAFPADADRQAEACLNEMFAAAVRAATPAYCVPPHLPEKPRGRTLVIGAGKAAASMARAVEDHWDGPIEGLVITRYGHRVETSRIEVVEAAHPVPDQAGLDATRRMLSLVCDLTTDDLVLCLISGGGSALLTAPAPGLTLSDKQAINRALLESGATIAEMNTLRKHLSSIKGGRLAVAAAPARVVSLVISDVPGDDLSMIASGPTIGDPTTSAQSLDIIVKYNIPVPTAVLEWLHSEYSETPKPEDPRLAGATARLIATPQASLEAAAAVAREHGLSPLILGSSIEGEARDVGLVHAGIVRQVLQYEQPVAAPCVLISGGETTVTMKHKGRGGRNGEFLLALAIALDGEPRVYAIAADTDGIDGSEHNAGAAIHPGSLRAAQAKGISARERLASNDSYGFFEAAEGLVVSGPTLTNVNDFRAILIR